MGNYATNANVASEFKTITFDGTTTVTDTEVDGFIDEAEAWIESKISSLYQVPVTGAKSILILKSITIFCVSDRVREIMQVKNVQPDELKQATQVPNGKKMAEDMIDDILSRKIKLVDAVLLATKGGVSSYTNDNGIDPKFQRDVDQW